MSGGELKSGGVRVGLVKEVREVKVGVEGMEFEVGGGRREG